MKTLFEVLDYKEYLNARLDLPPLGGRGARSRLCQKLDCQTSYLAQVLRGAAHLSLEQAEIANGFLHHSDLEAEYFNLSVLLARTVSPPLRERLGRQMEALREGQRLLKNRLGVPQPLGDLDRARYYSAWYFAAIHALVSIPGHPTPEAISNRLKLGQREVQEAVKFLVATGVLVKTQSGLEVGTARMHLGSDSPLIAQHHINWRLHSIRSLDDQRLQNLHYSSAISLSREDFEKIREKLIQEITELKAIIKESPSETVAALCFDFYEL